MAEKIKFYVKNNPGRIYVAEIDGYKCTIYDSRDEKKKNRQEGRWVLEYFERYVKSGEWIIFEEEEPALSDNSGLEDLI